MATPAAVIVTVTAPVMAFAVVAGFPAFLMGAFSMTSIRSRVFSLVSHRTSYPCKCPLRCALRRGFHFAFAGFRRQEGFQLGLHGPRRLAFHQGGQSLDHELAQQRFFLVASFQLAGQG